MNCLLGKIIGQCFMINIIWVPQRYNACDLWYFIIDVKTVGFMEES